MISVTVRSDRQTYAVVAVRNKPRLLASRVRQLAGRERRLFIVFDANFYALHGPRLSKALSQLSIGGSIVIPSGEKSKTSATVADLHDFLLNSGIQRTDLIVAVGGGVTTDLVGYAAATVLRGVDWIAVPTTLLGIVDAAIGGKTGVNHPVGKNTIGAFWHPSLVWCDTHYLNTLDQRQLVSGIGEIVKYAGLAGGGLLTELSALDPAAILKRPAVLDRLVDPCIAYKAKIVSRDPREGSIRAFLNLGHTIGHAVERSLGYGRLTHGESILLGLWTAVHVSRSRFPEHARSLDRYKAVIETWLRQCRRVALSLEPIMAGISFDKKHRLGRLNYILIRRPGRPIIVRDLTLPQLREALAVTLDRYREIGGTHV